MKESHGEGLAHLLSFMEEHVADKRMLRLIRKWLRVGWVDFRIGSVSSKGLKCEAYNLTTKIDGKTKTKHIPRILFCSRVR